MSAYNSKHLSVITIPYKMKKQIEKAKDFRKLQNKKDIMIKSRSGNLSEPRITCKDKKLNFYHGQSYAKFDNVPLASRGWKSKKSKGDFFTIQKSGENPAFLELENVPTRFEDLALDHRIVEQFKKIGIDKPTNIQSLAIPPILDGYNTLIAAETGNGKTYAFLAPIIHQLLKHKENEQEEPMPNSPKALIVVPGRELVIQIRDMARLIGGDLGLNINSMIGGRTKQKMLNPRIGTPDILVASFGALSKLVTTGIYKLHQVEHLVLDEADTLLDDSFNDSIRHFLKKFAIREQNNGEVDTFSGVQISFVGATFPKSMPSILDKVVEVDSLVHIKTPHLHRLSPHIKQHFIRVGHDERSERLLKIAKSNHKNRIPTIVFSNTSRTSDWVSLFLEENDVPCDRINGLMNSSQRLGKFNNFQNEQNYIISCTDLVSRGLNTGRAQHILNFDFPRFMADYIHRCGRTGRVGGDEKCNVTSFVYRPSHVDLVHQIEYASRKLEDLPNVNANITRIIEARKMRYEEAQPDTEPEEEEEDD